MDGPFDHGITIGLSALLLCAAPPLSAAQEPSDRAEAEIRQAVVAYVEAFNKHDAKALASLWSPEAVYTIRTSGDQVVGRVAMEQEFAAIFSENENIRLEATTSSVQFVSPNIAVEHGTARILRSEAVPEQTTYTAVYMKRDGQWLLDRVREEEIPIHKSHYPQLKDLEWMVGRWVDGEGEDRIETTCQWTRNKNFMTRSFTLSLKDRIEMAGMQIVGWDPAAKQIRSWVFDSEGGFAEGVWRHEGDRWFVQQSGVLPDGA